MKKADCMIVGLGLAGACLSLQLLERGRRLVVFDQPDKNRASRVAAGLFNPVTGRRVVKTWLASEVFSYLVNFYTKAEKMLGLNFFSQAPIYIPFRSAEEQNDWINKSRSESIGEFLLEVAVQSTYGDQVHDPLGGILLKGGHVDVPLFLDGVRNLLKEGKFYQEEEFHEENLIIKNDQIEYDGTEASQLAFCTGIHQMSSSIFSGLPLVPLKGEVIKIRTDKVLHCIYNRKVYAIKSGDHEYKIGSTYSLNETTPGTTEEGKRILEERTKELLSIPFETCHQDWGIRPATPDRRPLIGAHPKHKNIFIFNGLGTKGVSLAPYFSDQLAKCMEGVGNLDKEANINRVKSLYSKL